MPRLVACREDVLPALGELFRECGFEGASLARITAATGLGKCSLYHFFPGGKEEMASAVLADVDDWFEREVFTPLREHSEPQAALHAMFASTANYFASGGRICLVGAFALDETRDKFARAINSYFSRWIEALEPVLKAQGHKEAAARAMAEEIVAGIQGAIVLSRALGKKDQFSRILALLEERALNPR
jgi:AcrR family transcriptional regulator